MLFFLATLSENNVWFFDCSSDVFVDFFYGVLNPSGFFDN